MTAEQQSTQLYRELAALGYKGEAIDRVFKAGITNLDDALDLLNPTPASSSSSKQPMPISDTSSRGISRARDSLDRNDLHRATSSLSAAPGQLADESDMNLQRALLLSQKEQEERDTAEAMKRSKEQTSAPPDQDSELMRAIEESLKDNQPYRKSDHNVSWQSHAYPDVEQRIRKDLDQPVGLRNIGNTCYLNSLLQVYYHLPEFRRAIMAFRPPVELIQKTAVQPQTPSTQQAPVKMPVDDVSSELSPEERLERKLAESQPDQSFAMQPNGGEFKNPPEGNSGMSYNYAKDEDVSSPVQHAVLFVVELQKLFATMALGIQNCADPTGVMQAMRHHDGKPIVIGTQQDASEFNLLFLDIVERGLKGIDSSGSHRGHELSAFDRFDAFTMDNGGSSNVVKDMFTVQFRQELRPCGRNIGNECNIEELVPDKINLGETNAIIVDATTNEYRDLHSGLDDFAYAYVDTAPTSSREGSPRARSVKTAVDLKEENHAHHPALSDRIDSLDSGTSSKRMKSVWLTRLPPVVVIYLQRVRYNLDIAQAEKVHDRYDFDTEISFDRYMELNKSASIHAREIILRIRREKERLFQLLRTFRSFPAQRLSTKRHMEDTNTMATSVLGAPERKQRLDGHCDPSRLYVQIGKPDSFPGTGAHRDTFISAAQRVEARLREALNSSSELFQVSGIPKEDLQTSIEVLRAVVENDARKCESYRERLQSLLVQEKAAYNGLEESKYSLHAVLVHDGAPSGGHYWTFIRNWNASENELRWMKLSDSNVSYVTEEEMLSWSVGGKSMASAYCLIYTKSSQDRKGPSDRNVVAESRSLLPQGRVEEVDEASADFMREFGGQDNCKDN